MQGRVFLFAIDDFHFLCVRNCFSLLLAILSQIYVFMLPGAVWGSQKLSHRILSNELDSFAQMCNCFPQTVALWVLAELLHQFFCCENFQCRKSNSHLSLSRFCCSRICLIFLKVCCGISDWQNVFDCFLRFGQ